VGEARMQLERADKLQPEMPETLYSLGKAASLEGDAKSAERAWTKVVEIEKGSEISAQAHFALAGLYRKQGKAEDAEREMGEFKKLQDTSAPPEGPQK
jgi:outer membrane protein assembly factor BamD (BamD/ComL family)